MNRTIPPGYREVSAKTLAGYPDAIEFYIFNIYVTMICAAITFVNLGVLLSLAQFRQQHMIPIALAISNLSILFGVFTEALYRISLYTTVTETGLIPILNSRDCLLLTVFLRAIGDMWTPIIELLMGSERFAAVWYPGFFRAFMAEHSKKLLAGTVVIASISIIIPTIISVAWPEQDVAYSCGRKAAFSAAFGFLDYGLNVFGYLIAFLLNVLAFVKASFVKQSAKNLTKIRSYTLISLFSSILIAITNVASTLDALDLPIPSDVRRPTVVMAGLNSIVLFIVYIVFNVPYRMRFLQFVTFTFPKKYRVIFVSSSAAKTIVPATNRKVDSSFRSVATTTLS